MYRLCSDVARLSAHAFAAPCHISYLCEAEVLVDLHEPVDQAAAHVGRHLLLELEVFCRHVPLNLLAEMEWKG